MDKDMFDRLVESMTQMNEIIDGERSPSREYVIDSIQVKEIRNATGLTQNLKEPNISVAERITFQYVP